MRIRIIYTFTIVLLLLIIGMTVYYDSLVKIFIKNRCPDSCGNWIYGSCIDKQLYMERECRNYTVRCEEQKYFERKMITVGACSETDCKDGKIFTDYKCT